MARQVLIVEDHPLFAEAMQAVLAASIPDIEIVAVSTLASAKSAIAKHRGFAVVLLDLWLPDTHGFEGLVELRRRFPQLPVVVVSAFADPKVIEYTRVCGATGFISKASARGELVDVVRTVIDSDGPPPLFGFDGFEASCNDEKALTGRLRSLTRQQLRVLEMLCQGLLNKQIAFELSVGETTVKAHVSEILRKLSVTSRTQAVLEVTKLDFSAVLALYDGENAHDPSCTPHIEANHTSVSLTPPTRNGASGR